MLRLQLIGHDNMSSICCVVNAQFQFVLRGLKKTWLKEKSVGTEPNDLAAHVVNKYSHYCSTLGHIPHILRVFVAFPPLSCLYFLTELPSLPILWYSVIGFSVFLQALSGNSMQISLNIKILLKKVSLSHSKLNKLYIRVCMHMTDVQCGIL